MPASASMAIKRKIAVSKTGRGTKNPSTASDLRSPKGSVSLDVLYGLRAISRALHGWNDLEALRLLRLHWSDIVAAFEALHASQAAIAVPDRLTPLASKARRRRPRQTLTLPEQSTIPAHKLLSEASYSLPAKVSAAQ